MKERQHRRIPKPDWRSSNPRVTTPTMMNVAKQYQEQYDQGKPRADILEELADEYQRSERTIERWVSKGLKLLEEERRSEVIDLVTEEVTLRLKDKQEYNWRVQTAQKEHQDRLRDLIIEWRDSLFVPLPIQTDDRSSDPCQDVFGHRLFKRLREHLDEPLLWLDCWLWHWNFDIGYSGSCDWLKHRIRDLWWQFTYPSSPPKRYRYYIPVYERIESHYEQLKEGMGNGEKREPHNFEVKKSRSRKTSAKKLEDFLIYVDGELVCKSQDPDKVIEAYRKFSDEVIDLEVTRNLLFHRMILEDISERMRMRLDTILERQTYALTFCIECPECEAPDVNSSLKPEWAKNEWYEIHCKRHFDDMIAVGSIVWSRLQTLVNFKETNNSTVLNGNVVDGATWYSKDDWIYVTNVFDFMHVNSTLRLDTLLLECLIQHQGRRDDFNASWKDWRDITFDNLDHQTVDVLFTMLFEESFGYEANCPICYGLKQVFQTGEPNHVPW